MPYRSVKGYYLESSYGKLDLAFDLLPVYTTEQVARSYARLHEKETDEDEYLTEELILQEAMTALDGEVDFSVSDLDADAMLDGVIENTYEAAYAYMLQKGGECGLKPVPDVKRQT